MNSVTKTRISDFEMVKISKEPKHGTIQSFFSLYTTKKQKSDASLILSELIVTQTVQINKAIDTSEDLGSSILFYSSQVTGGLVFCHSQTTPFLILVMTLFNFDPFFCPIYN